MGSQTNLKTSQRGGCNPLNPPPGSATAPLGLDQRMVYEGTRRRNFIRADDALLLCVVQVLLI